MIFGGALIGGRKLIAQLELTKDFSGKYQIIINKIEVAIEETDGKGVRIIEAKIEKIK